MNNKIGKYFAIIFPAIGIICILLYALTAGKSIWILQSFAIFFFIGGAAYVGGGLMGFLFGIPKVVKNKSTEVTYTPNTNLEDVSDWLTKILLGVGLTQIDEIFNWLAKISHYAASDLYALGDESVFIACLIVYFVVCGFISGYLGTRIILPNVFNRNDNDLAKDELEFDGEYEAEKAKMAADNSGNTVAATTNGNVSTATDNSNKSTPPPAG